MVMLSFYVINIYYLDNYCEMAVNYHGKFFIVLAHGCGFFILKTAILYFGISTIGNVRMVVNYCSRFITLALGTNVKNNYRCNLPPF